MNLRQLVIGFIVLAVISAILLGSLLAVFEYKPEWIGLPAKIDSTQAAKQIEMPKPKPVKPVYIEPAVKITEKQLALFENGMINLEIMKQKKDSLIRLEKFLRDSLYKNYVQSKSMQDSVKRAIFNMDNAVKNQNFVNDSLNRLSAEYKKALDRNETLKKRLEIYEKAMASKNDTLETKNFNTFAKIYDNAAPTEVAKILEQIDERDAAKILKIMSKKKAGKVLEAMKPENAAAILLLGAGE